MKFSLLEKELNSLKKKSSQTTFCSTAGSAYSFSPMKSIKSNKSGRKSGKKSPCRSPSKSPNKSPSKASLNSPIQKSSSVVFNFQTNSRTILNDRTNTNIKHRQFNPDINSILPGELTKKKMKIN